MNRFFLWIKHRWMMMFSAKYRSLQKARNADKPKPMKDEYGFVEVYQREKMLNTNKQDPGAISISEGGCIKVSPMYCSSMIPPLVYEDEGDDSDADLDTLFPTVPVLQTVGDLLSMSSGDENDERESTSDNNCGGSSGGGWSQTEDTSYVGDFGSDGSDSSYDSSGYDSSVC